MRRTRIALLLAIVQILLAAALLAVGRRQVPEVPQDWPLFVGPAIYISLAINAPVMVLAAETISLFQKLSFGTWIFCYLVGVGSLWFLVGLEVERKMQKREARWRAFWGCLAITGGVFLGYTAFSFWRLDARVLATGSTVWAVVLLAVYGLELVRLVGSWRGAR